MVTVGIVTAVLLIVSVAGLLVDPTGALGLGMGTSLSLVGAAAACVLFALRKWKRSLYGLVEMLVGGSMIAAAGYAPSISTGEAIIAFVGGVFVVVRGLSNIDESRRGILFLPGALIPVMILALIATAVATAVLFRTISSS